MTVPIPFLYISVAAAILLAIDGITRGAVRESVITLVVLALSFLLIRPELMRVVIETNNDVNSIAHAALAVRGPDLARMAEEAAQAEDLITTGNAHYFFLTLLTVLLIGAYLLGGHRIFGTSINNMSRVIGAVLGAFNGYMIVAIAKEYLVQSFWGAATRGASYTLSLQFQNVPGDFPPRGYAGTALLIFILILTVLALISGIRVQLPVKAR